MGTVLTGSFLYSVAPDIGTHDASNTRIMEKKDRKRHFRRKNKKNRTNNGIT